jgi:hypothetical protein
MTADQITPVVLRLADGETRRARMWPHGCYSCPFCEAAVPSAAGWAESEQMNADYYAARDEPYIVQPYPASMARTWEARQCPNPACLTHLDAGQLAATRQRIADRQADGAQRERRHEAALAQIEAARVARIAACDDAAARCEQDGTCYRCWHRSTYGGTSLTRARFVRHRDLANCPEARRRGR